MLGAEFALLHAHAAPSKKDKVQQLVNAIHRASTSSVREAPEDITDDAEIVDAPSVSQLGSAFDILGSASPPHDFLPDMTDPALVAAAIKVQCCVRGRGARENFRAAETATVKVQAAARGHHVRRSKQTRGSRAIDPRAPIQLPQTGDEETLLLRLCEAWLSDSASVRMVVWDFDHTVVTINTVREGVGAPDVAQRWHADVYDLALFRMFVKVARQRGVLLGIASFGRVEVILAYVDQILLGTGDEGAFHAANVATPRALGLRDGSTVRPNGKPRLLKLLREHAMMSASVEAEKIARSAILFFDDKLSNIENCVSRGFTRCYHVPDGFTRQALAGARARAALPASPRPNTLGLAQVAAALRFPRALLADRWKRPNSVAAATPPVPTPTRDL